MSLKALKDIYTCDYAWLWVGFYGAANDVRPRTDHALQALAQLPTSQYLWAGDWSRF